MLIEYEVLRDRRGPRVAIVHMLDGVISCEYESEIDRLRIEPFLQDRAAFPRNRRFARDHSQYLAEPGTRTWLEETVEQRLYYSERYGYTVLVVPASRGYLILRAPEPGHRYRGLNRECFDELMIRLETPEPASEAAALRRFLAAWEAGFSESGLLERRVDAETVYSLIEDREGWELVYACDPGDWPPSGAWTRLGIDLTHWSSGRDSFSVLEETAELDLNVHALLAEKPFEMSNLTTHVPDVILQAKEVWASIELGARPEPEDQSHKGD